MDKEKILEYVDKFAKSLFVGVLIYGGMLGINREIQNSKIKRSPQGLETKLSLEMLQPAISGTAPSPSQIINIDDLFSFSSKKSNQKPKTIISTNRLERSTLGPNADYSFLMSDEEFTNSTYLTESQMQDYLNKINSALAKPIKNRYFSKEVYNSSQKYQLNPLLFLPRAQTEKGAVTKEHIEEKEAREIMGVDVTDQGRRTNGKYGFYNQIELSGKRLRQHYNSWSKGKKINANYGTKTIRPLNAASYALLKYTPHTIDKRLKSHGGGNHLFMEVYRRMKGDFETGKKK